MKLILLLTTDFGLHINKWNLTYHYSHLTNFTSSEKYPFGIHWDTLPGIHWDYL